MSRYFLLLLLPTVMACNNSRQLKTLNQSFEQGYHKLSAPTREQAAPIRLSAWDSLLKTYRLQLEQTTPHGDRAEQLWQALRHRLWVLEEQIQAYRQRPALYNLGGHCQAVLIQAQRPLGERLRQIHAQLRRASPYYQRARRNLQQFSADAAQFGISKQDKGRRFIEGALMDSLQLTGLPADTTQAIRQAAREAVQAMQQYQVYLEQRK